MNGKEEKLTEVRERELQECVSDLAQQIRRLADDFNKDPSVILSRVLTELEKKDDALQDNQIIAASAGGVTEQKKVSHRINPLPLRVYESDPSSKPSDELIRDMQKVLRSISVVTCMGDQSLALVASRTKGRRFNGIIREGNENTDHAFLEVHEHVQKTADGQGLRWPIARPLLANALLGRSDGVYDQQRRNEMYGKGVKLLQSAKLLDISIFYVAFPEVGANGLAGGRRGNPTLVSVQFDNAREKSHFEELIRQHQKKATNAFFSLFMSWDNFETLFSYEVGYTQKVTNVKENVFLNRDQYDRSVGTAVGTAQEGITVQQIGN